MIKIMNFAYYMLYEFCRKSSVCALKITYPIIYVFFALFGKSDVLKENHCSEMMKLNDRADSNVDFYVDNLFYMNYYLMEFDVLLILYNVGIDSLSIMPNTNFLILSIYLIIGYVIANAIHKKVIEKGKKIYFAEFDNFTFKENVKYSIYGIMFYLAPLIILIGSLIYMNFLNNICNFADE